jgi:hypothetical protein
MSEQARYRYPKDGPLSLGVTDVRRRGGDA